MSADYKDIRQELDWMEGMRLEEYAEEVAELRKENENLKNALADKALSSDGEMVAIYRKSLMELIKQDDHCKHCIVHLVSGVCNNDMNCATAHIRYLTHDWEGLKKVVESEDYI